MCRTERETEQYDRNVLGAPQDTEQGPVTEIQLARRPAGWYMKIQEIKSTCKQSIMHSR